MSGLKQLAYAAVMVGAAFVVNPTGKYGLGSDSAVEKRHGIDSNSAFEKRKRDPNIIDLMDFSPENIENWRRAGLCPNPAEPMPPTSCRYVEPVPQDPDEFVGADKVHADTVWTFVSESGFGRVRMFFAKHPLAPASDIERVELVSLLTGPEPSVYVLDQMPTAQIARQAKRRPLDQFEQLGLDAVRRGENLVWTQEAPTRMFGSIRAWGSCLECHTSAKEGDLLGAFTYYLKTPVDQLEWTDRFTVGRHTRTLAAKPRPLKMTVSFTARNPVAVIAYRAEDAEAFSSVKGFSSLKLDKALGSKRGTEGTFTIDVPANVKLSIMTVNGDEAYSQVKLILKTPK